MRYELLVSGMKCSGCVENVIGKLKSIDEVEVVSSSLAKENFVVDYAGDVISLVDKFNSLNLSYKIVEYYPFEEVANDTHKTKNRDNKEYRDLMNRLKRIEGQIRGLQRMLENDAYCIDMLTQVSAVNAALNSFNKQLLANHIKSCVTNDILEGKNETVDELVNVLQKVMK